MSDQVPSRLSPAQQAYRGSQYVAGGLESPDAWLDKIFNPEKYAEIAAQERAYRVAQQMSGSGGLSPEQELLQRAQTLTPDFMARAQRTLAQNPYDAAYADQSRAAQLALMQQMEAARTGPSLAAMQGRGAMGQSTQQALAMGAMGQGRVAMLGAGQTGVGLASDVARARMIEDLKARAGIGGAASQLRGQDISSATQQLRSGQQAQALSDEMARFYASQGSSFSDAARSAALERYKLAQRLRQQAMQEATNEQKKVVESGATIADIAL